MDDAPKEPKECATVEAAATAEVIHQKHVLPIKSLLAGFARARLAASQAEKAHTGHRTRLRESARQDLYALSDVELVELLLSFFIPQKDTNVVAHRLVERFGSVAGVLCASSEELIELAGITAQAATAVSKLFEMCLDSGIKELQLNNLAEAADFFGLAYLGKDEVGTYAAFMDGMFRVRAIEFFADSVPCARGIISSACKHRSKYVFIARREKDMFPQTFNIAAEVRSISVMLSDMGVSMLDYIIFTDYGYYTVGAPKKDCDWYPLYIFVPAIRFLRSPDLVGAVLSQGGALYAGRETAEEIPDFAKQICAAIKSVKS